MQQEDSHSGSSVYLNLRSKLWIVLVSSLRKSTPYHSYKPTVSTINRWKDRTCNPGDCKWWQHEQKMLLFLKAYRCKLTHSVSNADDAKLTPPALAEFTTTESADECCQNATKHICEAEAEFTLDKKKGIWDAQLLMELNKCLCHKHYDMVFSICIIISLFLATWNNVVKITPGKGAITVMIWLAMWTKVWAAAKAVPKVVPLISASATNNFSLQQDR